MQEDMFLLFQKKQQNPREEHCGNSLTQPIKDIRINTHKQQAEDTIQMFFQLLLDMRRSLAEIFIIVLRVLMPRSHT